MYRYESWTIKKAECWRTDAFKLWYWRRPLRVPWTARRSNQSILKEISPGCSLEGLMLKLQYPGHLMWRANSWKRPWGWERLRAGGEEGDRGWDGWSHHWFNGRESEQTPGDSGGQKSLGFCSPWSRRVWHEWVTEQQQTRSHKAKNETASWSLCYGAHCAPDCSEFQDYYFATKYDCWVWFSNPGLDQNHLKTLLKYTLLNPKPKVSNSIGLGKGT